MSSQHLSDEAIAACADGVLSGSARDRATKHAGSCPECAHAIAVQREAVWALRAAPAPALPSGLLDRLKALPDTTPITIVPSTFAPDGSAMFAAFGTMTAAALVPSRPAPTTTPWIRKAGPIALTAAALTAAGVVAIGSAGHAGTQSGTPGPTARVVPANAGPGAAVVDPAGFQRLGIR
jgi:anti-sigma factor RsiW